MKKLFLLLLAIPMIINAQLVEKGDLAIVKYGDKELRKGPKKIYVRQFTIMYQHLAEISATATNSDFSKETVDLGIVLNSKLTPEALQEITDKAYDKIANRLKENGFELISGDEAKQIPYYTKGPTFPQISGTPHDANGKIITFPKGTSQFVVTSKGNANYIVSEELNAPVLQFVADLEFVNLQTVRGVVTSIKKIKGESGLTLVPSGTIVYQGNGRKNVPAALVAAGIKNYKKIEIEGPIAKKKISETAYAKNNMNWSDGYMYKQEKSFKETKVIDADADLYISKVTQALDEYFDLLLTEFLSCYK